MEGEERQWGRERKGSEDKTPMHKKLMPPPKCIYTYTYMYAANQLKLTNLCSDYIMFNQNRVGLTSSIRICSRSSVGKRITLEYVVTSSTSTAPSIPPSQLKGTIRSTE